MSVHYKGEKIMRNCVGLGDAVFDLSITYKRIPRICFDSHTVRYRRKSLR